MMWRIMNFFFGFQYVVLIHYDGERHFRRAYALGDSVYANPYLPHTRCQLLPGGRCLGQSYVHGWMAVTDKTKTLFHERKKPKHEPEVMRAK